MSDTSGRPCSGIAIAGAGGFARETAEALHALNQDPDAHSAVFVGFLDDDPESWSGGFPVLGPIETIHRMPNTRLTICVGNPRNYHSRALIAERLELPETRYATIVHPGAEVSASSRIGEGSVLLAGAVLTADAVVGRHVAVMPQVVITHDVVVEDFATLASGVRLGGGAWVERGAYLGAGALIREGVRIGAWSQVGMGSVVLHDIGPGEIWVGNPARRLRAADIPEQLLQAAACRVDSVTRKVVV